MPSEYIATQEMVAVCNQPPILVVRVDLVGPKSQSEVWAMHTPNTPQLTPHAGQDDGLLRPVTRQRPALLSRQLAVTVTRATTVRPSMPPTRGCFRHSCVRATAPQKGWVTNVGDNVGDRPKSPPPTLRVAPAPHWLQGSSPGGPTFSRAQ